MTSYFAVFFVLFNGNVESIHTESAVVLDDTPCMAIVQREARIESHQTGRTVRAACVPLSDDEAIEGAIASLLQFGPMYDCVPIAVSEGDPLTISYECSATVPLAKKSRN